MDEAQVAPPYGNGQTFDPNSISGAGYARKVSEVTNPMAKPSTIVDEYSHAINNLEERAHVLEARLNTISRPVYEDKEPGPPTPEVSLARTQLQRLIELDGWLGRIIDRLEV